MSRINARFIANPPILQTSLCTIESSVPSLGCDLLIPVLLLADHMTMEGSSGLDTLYCRKPMQLCETRRLVYRALFAPVINAGRLTGVVLRATASPSQPHPYLATLESNQYDENYKSRS